MFSRRVLLGRSAGRTSSMLLSPISRSVNIRNNTCMSVTALQCNKRPITQLATNLTAHSLQLQGCLSLSTLLYSPLGTAFLLLLAYNVVVIGTKHVVYTIEITGKDYVQDQQLHQIMKYGIFACVLLAMEVLFVEV
ncbi:uncharacterized protein TM35_000083690 [Trypanosoma theileri]|uniref:Succinate dehydrogenase cytochrome B subunit n=1 Tax=Trypanosoma theileri TaxID=67003 RepID=A0A1X0P172_9TRYP|nr:uncharacterized protein TM35_000083690 [Trypanosoma theileri]ORC90571.1 hypothetical protein TM35_000083690 [Trypanosoma theileri]